MATRSNVRIMQGSHDVFLYRHWDGYPAENGRAILNAMGEPSRGDMQWARLIEGLLRVSDSRGGPVYELTDGWHGDIEWAYSIRFYEDKPASVVVRRWQWGHETPDMKRDEPDTWPIECNDLESFRILVAKEEERIAKRVAAMKTA